MILFLKAKKKKDFTFFQPSTPLIVSFKSSPVAFDGFIFRDLDLFCGGWTTLIGHSSETFAFFLEQIHTQSQ
jgi:hypothetical protein